MTADFAKSWRRRIGGAGILVLVAAGLFVLLAPGCYKPSRGNPVDQFHYEHSITVTQDYGHVLIQTYMNRNQWLVGLHREDLYDGDHDGVMTTPGLDRVFLTEYNDVEDPPESAQRSEGELQNYNELFQKILEAAKAGKKTFRNENRDYRLSVTSLDLGLALPGAR